MRSFKFLLISITFFALFGLAFRSRAVQVFQVGTCCSSSWNLPLLAGKWIVTQGDKDSCVSSHCAPTWEVNLYALDIASASESAIKTFKASILAPADGKILDEFWDGYGGGNVLKIEHGDGGPVSIYLHLDHYQVSVGQSVSQGDPVAAIGKSGCGSCGAHLHVTVFKSKTEKSGLKITSWDGNTSFKTGDKITSRNGSSNPVPTTPAPSIQSPSLSSPSNGSNWQTTDSVTLSWNSVSGASQYKVELWGGAYEQITPCDWQNGISCSLGTLWSGTMSWHVRARSSNGQESDWSQTWSFTVKGPTPTFTLTPVIRSSDTPVPDTPAPQNMPAPALRRPNNGVSLQPETDISFEWNYVQNATEYYLEYWGGQYGTLNSGWQPDVAYHVGVMWPGTYSWHVKARNSSGTQSPWSETRSFTIEESPTPVPTPTLAPPPATSTPPPAFQGNIAPRAERIPDGIGSRNAFDGDLSAFWADGLGHAFTLKLRLPDPMEISRILVWDRPQNSPDNNQINALIIRLSNGMEGRFRMDSQGARCIDATLASPQTVSSITLVADDASGNNGLSEVEIWVGPKTGGLSCANTGTLH